MIHTKFIYICKKYWHKPIVVLLLFLISLILFITALAFGIGYILGFNGRNTGTAYTTQTPSPTDIPFKLDFTITPYPPDESSWIKHAGLLHYHTYTISMPANFQESNKTNTSTTYTDTTNNVITISTVFPSQPITKQNDTIAGFPAYKKTSKNTEDIAVNLQTEELDIEGTNSISPFFIDQLAATITIASQAPEYPANPVTVSGSLLSLSYPSSYIADTLTMQGINCNGQPESLVHLKDPISTITIDMNTCIQPHLLPVTKASFEIVQDTKYMLVFFKHGPACYISSSSPSMKALALYPLKDWMFAPDVTSINTYPTYICMSPSPSAYAQTTETYLLQNFSSVLQSLTFVQPAPK